MSGILQEVLEANRQYAAEFGAKKDLALPPSRKFAVLTCMDARLDPAKFAGLAEGDAHVIRNAGGRGSDDAIRSLLISHKLLGTQEWFVIHHTNCGMTLFSNEIMADLLAESLEPAVFDGKTWTNPSKEGGSAEGAYINFLAFDNLEKSVVDDVRRIRRHPLVPRNIPIYGYIYDVHTGLLLEVPDASASGRPA
jgi:carbonic anhydrase